MHISSIFYPKRFKKIIAELKRCGLLRRKPLYALDVQFLAFAGIGTMMCFMIAPVPHWQYIVCYLFTFSVACFYIRRDIAKFILPCSVGIAKPIIVVESTIHFYHEANAQGWSFSYYFPLDANDPVNSLERLRYHRAPYMPRGFFNKKKFLHDQTFALVDPENPDCPFPYVEKFALKFRMTKEPVVLTAELN